MSATDPDEDGTIPILSVDCTLEGYAISVKGDGSAVFNWTATSTPGLYTVMFFASDGFLIDTETVTIAVSQAGELNIKTTPANAAIFAMPAGGASTGMQIGIGNATWNSGPGTYWFRADAPGYRSELFTGKIEANQTNSIEVTLKNLIPLMITPPEGIKIGSGDNRLINGSISFCDFDGDGIQDLSVAHGKQFTIYMGSDSIGGMSYRVPATTIALPAELDSIVAHSYSDWDNGDLDGDGWDDFVVIRDGACMQLYVSSSDSARLPLPVADDCNAGGGTGKRCHGSGDALITESDTKDSAAQRR